MMSAHWACWLWTVVGAGLLGWGIKGVVLGPVMDDKRRELERLKNKVTMLTSQPPEVRTVEKRVEVPVERVVVKRVEVPVEKAVDRPIDSPEHLARIKALEGEVAVIAELRAQIAELRAVSSQAGEQVVEKRIEPPAEKIVVPNADVPVGTISEHTGDLDQAGAVEPSDEGQAIGKSSDDLKQIRGVGPALERFLHKRGVFWFSQVATWSQADIDKFEFLLPNFGGRIQRENWVRSAQVEYYKKYKQWLGDGEPSSESLEFPAQIAELQAASSQAGEQAVEKRIEPPTEQNGEMPIDKMSEHTGDLDQTGAVEPSDKGQAIGESSDDLKQIRGVGPALERFLHKRGVFWFSQVATWSQADIDKFEFLLPNFGGRIQRENWVGKARFEYYKKYRKWLSDDQPPSTTPERQ